MWMDPSKLLANAEISHIPIEERSNANTSANCQQLASTTAPLQRMYPPCHSRTDQWTADTFDSPVSPVSMNAIAHHYPVLSPREVVAMESTLNGLVDDNGIALQPKAFTVQTPDSLSHRNSNLKNSETNIVSKAPQLEKASTSDNGKQIAPSLPSSTTVTVQAAPKIERKLTALELQRIRNRESLQRARKRQRDELAQMKVTCVQLTQQYEQLLHASKTGRVMTDNTRLQCQKQLVAEYNAVTKLTHTLQEEKFFLEQVLADREKTIARLNKLMLDRDKLGIQPYQVPDSLFSDFIFTPITEQVANMHIQQCYRLMRLLEETSQPLSTSSYRTFTRNDHGGSKRDTNYTASKEAPLPASATFGWSVACQMTVAHNFFVCFSKFFPLVVARDAMEKTWVYTKPTSPAKKLPLASSRTSRNEVVQLINERMFVAGMDQRHPVKKNTFMRAMHLNFCLETRSVIAVGQTSVNPKSHEVRTLVEEHFAIEYVDWASWIEFIPRVDPATGVEGCLVKYCAHTEYNTQEDMYVRLLNALRGTLRWESAIMPSTLMLQPS